MKKLRLALLIFFGVVLLVVILISIARTHRSNPADLIDYPTTIPTSSKAQKSPAIAAEAASRRNRR